MKTHLAEWQLHVNRASCKNIRDVGIILKGLDEVTIEYAVRLKFKTTNNMVKYEALIKRLDLAKGIKAKRLNVYND